MKKKLLILLGLPLVLGVFFWIKQPQHDFTLKSRSPKGFYGEKIIGWDDGKILLYGSSHSGPKAEPMSRGFLFDSESQKWNEVFNYAGSIDCDFVILRNGIAYGLIGDQTRKKYQLIKTQDHGASWKLMGSSFELNEGLPMSLHFLDAKTAAIVTHHALYITYDEGQSWIHRKSISNLHFHAWQEKNKELIVIDQDNVFVFNLELQIIREKKHSLKNPSAISFVSDGEVAAAFEVKYPQHAVVLMDVNQLNMETMDLNLPHDLAPSNLFLFPNKLIVHGIKSGSGTVFGVNNELYEFDRKVKKLHRIRMPSILFKPHFCFPEESGNALLSQAGRVYQSKADWLTE